MQVYAHINKDALKTLTHTYVKVHVLMHDPGRQTSKDCLHSWHCGVWWRHDAVRSSDHRRQYRRGFSTRCYRSRKVIFTKQNLLSEGAATRLNICYYLRRSLNISSRVIFCRHMNNGSENVLHWQRRVRFSFLLKLSSVPRKFLTGLESHRSSNRWPGAAATTLHGSLTQVLSTPLFGRVFARDLSQTA